MRAADGPRPAELKRELHLAGAVMMGLGSMIGTGVFVSIGVAAGAAGPSVILAIALAAVVAVCNALSSAQLAAAHPVSGGTYEYGYRLLNPALGFTAGWMFLCAKSASAATAALGFAGYALHAVGADPGRWLVPLAVGTSLALTAVVLAGLRRSNAVNTLIVSVTLASLTAFLLAGLPVLAREGLGRLSPFFAPAAGGDPAAGFLRAAALMFVAFTGYGRIATMGEEVREPQKTIPRAIGVTMAVTALLYMAVGFVAVAGLGAAGLMEATEGRAAPLEIAADRFGVPAVRWGIAAGAMTAMLGVLLNLILGLSRVLLAMGRRLDMPAATARLDRSGSTPVVAVAAMGGLIAALAAIGSVKTTWSFSAFTVLVYYAVTNLAALRLAPPRRLYPPVFAWCGLGACLFLAFWVQREVWLSGLALIAAGLLWHRFRGARQPSP